ncbi:MAG: hypothetical protein ACLQAT_18730 [Candidatus Binataceae bacterium]
MLASISAFFSWLACRFHSRAELELELIALRHQNCPSRNCVYDEFAGTVNGNPVGKGTVEAAATIDHGAALSGGDTCFPVFVILEIAVRSGSQVINDVGAACAKV